MNEMKIKHDYDLFQLNTFGIQAKAKFFVEINSEAELQELFQNPIFIENKKFFLGGGSNVLFTKDFEGIVVKISLLGKKIIEDNPNNILLEVNAGENWHDLVTYAVNNNWGGIENLAFIPGTVGAAPVQNIAAYGENFSDVFESLDAFNVENGDVEKFSKDDCEFDYRESIFKTKLKGKYIILKVRIRLLKNPQIETSYYQMGITRDSIKDELEKLSNPPYTIRDVYNAVVSIRIRKLPDPKKVPTVGSFFLNLVVTKEKYNELRKEVSELQCYPVDQLHYKDIEDAVKGESNVKIATGRILQELGWLGKWIGNVGVHDKHALVLVTNGKASGEEVINFAHLIMEDVKKKFGLELVPEVNIV